MKKLTPVALGAAAFVAAASLVSWTGCASTSPEKKTNTKTTVPTPAATNTPAPPTATPTPVVTATPTPPPCAAACTPSTNTRLGQSCIVPMSSPQLTSALTIGSNEYYQFDFVATSGVTYNFTVCTNGGTYTGDTYFFIYDGTSCTQLALQDDTCGLGSDLSWVATSSGTMAFWVRGFGWSACTCTIAYWTT